MKTALIIGATGLTGKELCQQLIDDVRYDRIIILVRKQNEIDSNKIEQIVFDFDILKPSDIYADEFYCCLGTTIKKAGSKEEFLKVDYDYVVNTAKLAYKNGIKNFAVVSAMGANKKSKIFYNRVKGEMEDVISKIGFVKCCILRPSLIIGKRTEFRFGESVAKLIMLAFSFIIPARYKAVHAKKIAKTMIDSLNSEKQGLSIIESDKIYSN